MRLKEEIQKGIETVKGLCALRQIGGPLTPEERLKIAELEGAALFGAWVLGADNDTYGGSRRKVKRTREKTGRPALEVDVEELWALRNPGGRKNPKSLTELAKIFGCSRATVITRLRLHKSVDKGEENK